MIDEKSFNKIASIVVIAALLVLTFLILRPILMSSIFALILAFIFYPVYKKVRLLVKSENLSALIICVILLVIIIVPTLFFTPIIIKQTFEVYSYIQGTDVLTPFKKVFPSFFSSQEISTKIAIAINAFTNKMTSTFLNKFTDILLNSPTIFLRLLIIMFVFFFGLRDGEKLMEYIQSLSPLSKESEVKILKQFKEITYSVIFGQIGIGIVQGVLTGIALFVLGIPNAVVLTLLAIFLSIMPLIGPWPVWVTVDLYLFSVGRTNAAIGLLVYGLILVSLIDNVLRSLILSKRTKINSAVILVSMIGGLFVFGILGLVIGPLVIAYLLLLFENFRNKKVKSILVQKMQ